MQGVLRATEEDITPYERVVTNRVRMAGDRTHSFRSRPSRSTSGLPSSSAIWAATSPWLGF